MQRRTLVQILASSALARPVPAQSPAFFTPSEFQILERLCDLLLPSDATGPGAREAQLAASLDAMLHPAPQATQQEWRAALALVNQTALAAAGRPFLECEPAVQESVMREMAAAEDQPQTPLQRFFPVFKALAIDAFSNSPAGKRFFGYQGDTALARFSGCTHPEHQSS
jgi:hypothetical protein